MAFWIAAGVMSVMVAMVVALAARRPSSEADKAPAAAYDLRVYRDQLRDVERDVARGILSPDDADRTRTEISRRILEADRALQAAQGAPRSRAGFAVVGLGLMAVIAGSVWLYGVIGAPGYGDLPLVERIARVEAARETRPDQATAEAQVPERPAPEVDPERAAMVAQLREVLAERPDDAEGIALLAANEAALGNFADAHAAQARLLELLGDEATGRNWIDYAEMLILAASGYVSPEAEAALLEGLQKTPTDGTGRFFIGEMYAQQGRPDLALPIWSNLLSESRPGAPWIRPIQAQISAVARAAGVEIDPSLIAPGTGGPSAAQIAATDDMSPEDQQAMIENMVAGLADRLSTEGGPPQDWAQLITAYGVLGRTNAAQIVHEQAMNTFEDVPEALQIIDNAFRAAMARVGPAAVQE